MADTLRVTTVIIPAHNESRVIGRALDSLLADAVPGEFEIIVVCNGCSDNTVDVARRQGVRVVEIRQASKRQALIQGDAQASTFPRLYIDADIELDTQGLRALVGALEQPGVLAVAPERRDDLERSSWAVRAYYRIWCRLPAVNEGLFGRGVLGISEAGHPRIAARPDVMGDDLYVNSQFGASERRIVPGARSTVHAPRTLSGLVRRRVRATQGNAEMSAWTAGRTNTTAGSGRYLAQIAVHEPAQWASLAVFTLVTLVTRVRSARSQQSSGSRTWLRDDTTRV